MTLRGAQDCAWTFTSVARQSTVVRGVTYPVSPVWRVQFDAFAVAPDDYLLIYDDARILQPEFWRACGGGQHDTCGILPRFVLKGLPQLGVLVAENIPDPLYVVATELIVRFVSNDGNIAPGFNGSVSLQTIDQSNDRDVFDFVCGPSMSLSCPAEGATDVRAQIAAPGAQRAYVCRIRTRASPRWRTPARAPASGRG